MNRAPEPVDGQIASLPAHIEETVRQITRLHAEHLRGATPMERALRRLTRTAARPWFLAALTAALILWTACNALALRLGFSPVDPPPFAWMETVVSVAALYTTMLVLSTQTRDDQLSNLREQLILELAIVSEQKTAKTIELLEELRRDSSAIPNRFDREAAEMAGPADPHSVLDAIRESHAEAERACDGPAEAAIEAGAPPPPAVR